MKVNNNAIVIENLYTIYNEKTPQAFLALRNINYAFEKGKIYFIIGKSGCGKSTLLSYFNGLSYPKYGSVKINNFNLESKKNLNEIIHAEICDENLDLSHKFKKKYDASKHKIIILQCSADAKKYPVSLKFSATKRDQVYAIKNIKKMLPLSHKTFQSKFFALVVDKEYVSDYPVINMNDVKDYSSSYFTGKRWEKHKIKNYKELRKQVGVVYQFPEYQLFKSTILEDVAFGPINLGFSKEEAHQASIKTLAKLGIGDEYLDKSPFGLSGGQKRRVALSGILAINPDILVFDEPTAGLDPQGEREMLQIMLDAKQEGKTVFVVTHSMEQVLEIADEVVVIDDGQIIKAGTPYEIFNDEKITEIASVVLPKTISFINDLIKIDKKYEILYKYQPRNAKELANCLLKIKKGQHA